MNLLPAYIYAKGESGGVDMTAYSTIAGYGFLIIIILFFSLFLYYYSDKFTELPKTKTPAAASASGKLTAEIMPTVNLIHYSVISLILLYILIFVFLIL